MKTVQFNANNILNGNNYPIAYYYPIAKDLVVISTGHDDSIIDDPEGYSEYIIPILEAILKTSIKVLPVIPCFDYFYRYRLQRYSYIGLHYRHYLFRC